MASLRDAERRLLLIVAYSIDRQRDVKFPLRVHPSGVSRLRHRL